MMLFRSTAAICGAAVALAVSVTVARSEINAVHSSAVVNDACGDAIVGAASMYNPFRPGWREGGPNTASGERYDPLVWAAAIKTSLRQKFGGVEYGARPKYALVEAVGKKVIVKINDVGPLTPGRIIDLNEQTMRYFDPSLQLGVINRVSVRPLLGDYWVLDRSPEMVARESGCRSTAWAISGGRLNPIRSPVYPRRRTSSCFSSGTSPPPAPLRGASGSSP